MHGLAAIWRHWPLLHAMTCIEMLCIPQGIISRGTLERMARLRANGTRVVLITGARTSTLIQRAPHLPQADAYVSENGGRIFYCDDCSTGKAEAFCEDMDWRERHSAVAGPSSQDEAEAADRQVGACCQRCLRSLLQRYAARKKAL